MPWTRRKTRFADLDVINRVLAVHETWRTCGVLVDRGWLVETEQDGVGRFARS